MILYLVRHAAVDVRADTAPHEWQLSPAGIEAAAALARAPMWPGLVAIASSPEPKARATAEPIAAATGRSLQIEAALREVERPLVAPADYEALVAAHFTSALPGWEQDPAARIGACIDRLVATTDGPLCVVAHGLILTHYVARVLDRPPDLAAWRAMPMPAVAIVDTDTRQLLAPFHSV